MKLDVDQKIESLFHYLHELGESIIDADQVLGAFENLEPIPPFLRALLVTDGTVTMALEAFFAEGIRVNTLRQGRLVTPISLPALEIAKHVDCFYREVELVGTHSGTRYAHACSILNKQAIDADLFEQLVSESVGIGIILRNIARGSFREVLKISRDQLMAGGDISRTYRVSINGLPAILITEEFSQGVYR